MRNYSNCLANDVPMRKDSELVRLSDSLSDIRDVTKSLAIRLHYCQSLKSIEKNNHKEFFEGKVNELRQIEELLVRVMTGVAEKQEEYK